MDNDNNIDPEIAKLKTKPSNSAVSFVNNLISNKVADIASFMPQKDSRDNKDFNLKYKTDDFMNIEDSDGESMDEEGIIQKKKHFDEKFPKNKKKYERRFHSAGEIEQLDSLAPKPRLKSNRKSISESSIKKEEDNSEPAPKSFLTRALFKLLPKPEQNEDNKEETEDDSGKEISEPYEPFIWKAEIDVIRLGFGSGLELSVCYSPDGTRIVSGGSYDRTVRVWDDLLGRCDIALQIKEWEWLINQKSLSNIFSIIFRSEEHAKAQFVRGTEEFWKRENLEISAKSLIENQNATALLNLVRGLDSIEILQNHLYLIGTLQTLEKPVPQNLETFVCDPTVVRWINTVLEHPFCKFMILMDGILQIAHMFCFGYASFYFQDIEGSYSDISNNPRDSSNEFIPIIWMLFVITTYFTSFEIYQGYSMYQLGLFSSWAIDFWNFVDVGCMICSYTLFGYALYESSRSSYEYRVVASIGALCLWIRLIGFLKIFNIRLATFVLSLFQVFADLKSFSIILIAFFVMFTQAFFILANSKDSVSDVEEFSSIKNIFFMLFGMLLGEYYLEEFDHSWLLLALKIFFMFLMTIIMLNILIAVVSDSYENAITRARKIYLRALFQLTANHILLFEYILSQRFDPTLPTDFLTLMEDSVIPLSKWMLYYPDCFVEFTLKKMVRVITWVCEVLVPNLDPLLAILVYSLFVCIYLVFLVVSLISLFCIHLVAFVIAIGVEFFLVYPTIFMFHVLKYVHLLNVSSMIEDESDNEWLGRVLDMERRLDKIVKSSQEIQMETSVSQIKELRSQMENQNKELRCQIENQNTQLKVQNKELTSKVEALESKLDLLLEAIKNPSS